MQPGIYYIHAGFFFQIYSMDVTPGGLAVSSDSEGKLKIWETANGTVRVSIFG